MSLLLDATAVRAGYGKTDVLTEVSLQVRPGELWVILGPNGAGKSTFLKACLGLVPLRSGSVELLGKALGQWDRRTLAQSLAWVPQVTEVEAGFTVLDLVLMGRAPHYAGFGGGLGLASRADVASAHAALEELARVAPAGLGDDQDSLFEAQQVAQAALAKARGKVKP